THDDCGRYDARAMQLGGAMGVSTFELASFTFIMAALVVWWAYSRSSRKALRVARKHGTPVHVTTWGTPEQQWGMQIDSAGEGRTCAAARELIDRRFPMAKIPPLPLPDCPYPRQCECHYRRLADERVAQ